MKAVRLHANWDAKKDFKLGNKDVQGRLTYRGSQVWRYPELRIDHVYLHDVKDDEVLIEVKRCGICGSDVHMYQTDKKGYIQYPGLTAFPCTLGHEIAGIIEKQERMHSTKEQTNGLKWASRLQSRK